MKKIPPKRVDAKSSSGEGANGDEFQVEEDYSYLVETPTPQFEKVEFDPIRIK